MKASRISAAEADADGARLRAWLTRAVGGVVAAVGGGTLLRRASRSASGSAAAPLPAGLLDAADTPSTVVVDRHGDAAVRGAWPATASARVRLDAATLAADRSRPRRSPRRIAASGRTPASIRSPIARALGTTSPSGGIVEGGSTITQQVAKLLLDAAGAGSVARLAREAPRGGPRAAARASLHEARDPRAVPEPGGVRQPDRRRRAREPGLLRRRVARC